MPAKQPTEELARELKPLIAEALEIWTPEPSVALPPETGTAEVLPGPQLVGHCRAMRVVYQLIGQACANHPAGPDLRRSRHG